MKKYLGVDLGGTNVRVAVVSEKGDILEELKRPSLADKGPEIVLDNIIEMIGALKTSKECLGVGIGIPGPVDTERGCVTLATNISGFAGFPVVDYMKSRLNMPVYLDNDANVAGLAEAVVGSGRGKKIVYYVTQSTGIGGALIVSEKVVSGKNGYAGEIANIVIDRNRPKTDHLNKGAVENWASGVAMVRQARELIDPEIDSAYSIFLLAQDGNEKAVKLVETMCDDMGLMFSIIAHVCEPHVFILGGGVSQSHEFYLDTLIERYKSYVHPGMRDTEFRLASLDEPGVIGAAMLCYSNEER